MEITPASIHREQQRRRTRLQEGTLLSFTTVRHPPEDFGTEPAVVGLLELADGTRVAGRLLVSDASALHIGQSMTPRMCLMQVREDGLRRYDIAYTPAVRKDAAQFQGYIVALTGPSGVGKTTISALLSTRIGQYVERVPILTTRDAKPGDEDEYVRVTPEEFSALEKSGDIAAMTLIPSSTEKRKYGYRVADIEAIWSKGKFPLVITEMHLLQGLSSHFGRRSILSFGLLPPGRSKRQMLSSLLHRLRTRGRDSEEQIEDRMKNAEADLAFFESKQELFDHLVINDKLETVLEHMKGHVLRYAEEPAR